MGFLVRVPSVIRLLRWSPYAVSTTRHASVTIVCMLPVAAVLDRVTPLAMKIVRVLEIV